MRTFFARFVIAVAVVFLGVTFVGVSDASAANSHSPIYAGRLGTKSAGFTRASGRFTVPDLACPVSGEYKAFITLSWSGVFDGPGGGGAEAHVQAQAECNDGAVSVSGSVGEFDPTGSGSRSFFMSEGDVIRGDFTYNPTTGTIWVVARNLTSGETVGEGARYKGLRWIGANAVVTRGPALVTPFGSVQFSSLTIGGDPWATSFNSLVAYDLYSLDDTTRLVRTGSLNTAGTAFKAFFVNSG